MFPMRARFPLPRGPSRKFSRPSLRGCATARSSRRSSSASIAALKCRQRLGDVNTPACWPLNSVGERLLALIARAGGPKFEAIESYVTLQRDGKRVRVLLSRVVHDPRENIFIDRMTYLRHPQIAHVHRSRGAQQNVFGNNGNSIRRGNAHAGQAIGKAAVSTTSSRILRGLSPV